MKICRTYQKCHLLCLQEKSQKTGLNQHIGLQQNSTGNKSWSKDKAKNATLKQIAKSQQPAIAHTSSSLEQSLSLSKYPWFTDSFAAVRSGTTRKSQWLKHWQLRGDVLSHSCIQWPRPGCRAPGCRCLFHKEDQEVFLEQPWTCLDYFSDLLPHITIFLVKSTIKTPHILCFQMGDSGDRPVICFNRLHTI